MSELADRSISGKGLESPTIDRDLESSRIDVDDVVPSSSWIKSQPVTRVRIESLVIGDSPRQEGENWEHVRVLAESCESLPPIIVHQPTMRVIDGVHRVQAAMLNNLDAIEARLVDCDANVAFILAVEANVAHGLPLSQADRVAAANRIISANPQWSDRAVAAATGLSGKTVSRIRCRSSAENPRSGVRLGRDGRLRPLDSGAKRRQAAAMINDNPEAGLRTIARATGLSLATVQDVRQRVGRGEDPVPERYRSANEHEPAASAADSPPPRTSGENRKPRSEDGSVDQNALLAKLRNDPSLKFNESGRHTLRWLHRHTVDPEDLEGLCRDLPDHCAPVIADLARGCATAWITLAERLRQRID
ncbi:ParB/RepB/Spo0J family partition protein [Spirillospora sp. CA-294931]|uniref:ParB/RepB/Spo0J family partition protein n=1 Tax=Spirillospora sp. CA-294931 TaxID=3240042 RepID=UPI003D8E1E7E